MLHKTIPNRVRNPKSGIQFCSQLSKRFETIPEHEISFRFQVLLEQLSRCWNYAALSSEERNLIRRFVRVIIQHPRSLTRFIPIKLNDEQKGAILAFFYDLMFLPRVLSRSGEELPQNPLDVNHTVIFLMINRSNRMEDAIHFKTRKPSSEGSPQRVHLRSIQGGK